MASRAIVEIRRTAQTAVRVPFEALARKALPRGYVVSLVLCGDTLASRMNSAYRKKTYSPNVLSFSLSKTEGEIFLNVRKAEREARSLGISARGRLALLFVHACLHLTGLDHGKVMDQQEERILKSRS
jgi:rRNA maturation RNase YbeY